MLQLDCRESSSEGKITEKEQLQMEMKSTDSENGLEAREEILA